MSYNIKSALAPIEVFFRKTSKGYFARGKVSLLFARIFEKTEDIDRYQGVYRLGVYAFVNNEYLKTSASADPEDKTFFFHFIGSNQKEYSKNMALIANSYIKSKTDAIAKINPAESATLTNYKLNPKDILNHSNKPFKLNSLKFPDDAETSELAKQKTPVIPYGLFLDPENIFDRTKNKYAKPFVHSSFHLFACNFTEVLKHYPDSRYRIFAEWLSIFYDQLAGVLGYPKTTKIDFIKQIQNISNLAYQWITTKKPDKALLAGLNSYIETAPDTDCYLTNFYYSIYDDLIDAMLTEEAVTECELCGMLFSFDKNKKYCSLKSEGKNCGKRARNKKFYGKHRIRLLKRQRIETRLTRKFYKSKGIK